MNGLERNPGFHLRTAVVCRVVPAKRERDNALFRVASCIPR
jgi:hypothetical protein